MENQELLRRTILFQLKYEYILYRENVTSPPESTAPSVASTSVASSPSQSTFDEIVASKQSESGAHEQGPSFAEMLRNTGTRLKSQTAWPSINSSYGKQSSNITVQSTSRNYDEEEDYTPVPSHSQSFGDALAAALQQTKLGTFILD